MKKILAVLALALSPVGAACDSDDRAQLRVGHLSPDAPAVDVYLDGSRILENVAFEAISEYRNVVAGSHRVQVTPAGMPDAIVIDATVQLEKGEAYTAAATGLLGEDDLTAVILADDRRTLTSEAKVRFVHASPDAPAVDVAVTGGPVLLEDVSFRDASEFLSVDAATYDLEVRVAGTSTVALSVPDVTLSAATNYTIFAIGLVGDGSLAALPIVDATSQ